MAESLLLSLVCGNLLYAYLHKCTVFLHMNVHMHMTPFCTCIHNLLYLYMYNLHYLFIVSCVCMSSLFHVFVFLSISMHICTFLMHISFVIILCDIYVPIFNVGSYRFGLKTTALQKESNNDS